MNTSNQEYVKPRSFGRRQEDFFAREKIKKHGQLFSVGQIITSEMNLNSLFEVIMDQTNQIMGTQRSTVLLYDEKRTELWSLVATGMKKDEIRIPSNHGVAGWVFQNNMPLIINDAYNDPRFYAEVDKKSGFRTKNILCVPLVNRKGQCIGSLQTLNKISGDFTDEDKELLISLSHYVAIALENSRLYEDVKNYSEELKTTLIRIETLERVKSQLTKFVPGSVAKMVEHDPDRLTFEKVPMEVTILFIDIQGFSRITEGFDQRVVNDMVECHFSRYLECIYRHCGEVNETSGDGLMVIFKDATLESHAKKAVAAGLEIVSENSRLNEEFSYPWGRVDLHLGINTGEAWVGSTKMKTLTGERWTYTASGLVTVLAARIGALSSETKLYVGPETYRCIQNSCACEAIGIRELKNVKTPLEIYRVIKAMENLSFDEN
jgi:class 3 adenylate cyclase/putative methionine-R-sulfoxide reductase with GAF domain